mgnify:CR=1 FL=1
MAGPNMLFRYQGRNACKYVPSVYICVRNLVFNPPTLKYVKIDLQECFSNQNTAELTLATSAVHTIREFAVSSDATSPQAGCECMIPYS